MNHYDYLIIGQGLAGSALAWELIQRKKKVMVMDEPSRNLASSVAAGMCNPITGKMMAKTWKAETIFPQLEKFYSQAGENLKQKFFSPVTVYRPFISEEEKKLWSLESNMDKVRRFVVNVYTSTTFPDQVINPFGGAEIRAGHLNVGLWLSTVRDFLKSQEAFMEAFFNEEELMTEPDSIRYKQIIASKIIFCNGMDGLQSRWFGWLPLIPLKGETLNVAISVKPHRVYSRGVYLVPSSSEGIYIVGATYQHTPFPEGVSSEARADLETKLRTLVTFPFNVIHQDWGIRPTTPDRRALLGVYPRNKNVVIFNGLGTKGVSLAPHLALLLADWMEGSADLPSEVNISRFKTLYSG